MALRDFHAHHPNPKQIYAMSKKTLWAIGLILVTMYAVDHIDFLGDVIYV